LPEVELEPELEADELEADELSRFSVLVAFSAAGFEPQPRMTARQNSNAISLKRIKGYPPQSEAVVSLCVTSSNRTKAGSRR
jgi:hypothetical protein